ncbi:MAG: phosphosulfolactate synthase [Alphaproteobacteria bacterium]
MAQVLNLIDEASYARPFLARPTADFLTLRPRAAKPRTTGLTCVIDGGLGPRAMEDLLVSAAPFIDFVKFGWGTGVISPALDAKIGLLERHGVGFWFGGTLFELAHAQGKLEDYVAWALDMGATHFEVSDGSIELPEIEKLRSIERLSRSFIVFSEVGSKDAAKVMTPDQWIERIRRELAAGAWKVITEGRESGTAGLFQSDGDARADLMGEILTCGIDLGRVIFEAPQKKQQIAFLRSVGFEANLGNVPAADALNLETLRLGLRSDTLFVPK